MSATRVTYAGRWAVNKLEVCTLKLDLSKQDELLPVSQGGTGDTLTGTPTVTATDADGSNITLSNPAVSGATAVTFKFNTGAVRAADQLAVNGPGYSDYAVRISCATAAGTTIVRTATVRVEE